MKKGDTVYAFSFDCKKEEDWNKFIEICDWFVDDAPLDEIKAHVLSHPGWVHWMDLEKEEIDDFMASPEWFKLRDSGLSIAFKMCTVTEDGYVSPNDVYTK